jgi:hypothetical protein
MSSADQEEEVAPQRGGRNAHQGEEEVPITNTVNLVE